LHNLSHNPQLNEIVRLQFNNTTRRNGTETGFEIFKSAGLTVEFLSNCHSKLRNRIAEYIGIDDKQAHGDTSVASL